VYSTYIYHMQF